MSSYSARARGYPVRNAIVNKFGKINEYEIGNSLGNTPNSNHNEKL